MAYIVKRETASGVVTYHLRFRDPKTHAWRQVAVEGGRAEAEAAVANAERVIEQRDRVREGMTAAEVFAAWLEHLRTVKGLREASISAYDGKVGRVVRGVSPSILRRWTPRAVLAFIRSPERSAPTIVAYLVTTATFLKWARRNGYAVPVGLLEAIQDADRPTVRPVDREVLSEDDVRSILRASAGTTLHVPVCLAALAGLSYGDLKTLPWSEVDLDAGTLWRRQGRHKTGKRLRVPLAPELVGVLKANRHDGALVCRLGTAREDRALLNAAWDAAGVPRSKGDGWHALRHAFASHLGAMGVPLATIRVLMGHAPGSVTTLKYLKPIEQATIDATKAIGKRLGG